MNLNFNLTWSLFFFAKIFELSCDAMLSRFETLPARDVMDKQSDRLTDRQTDMHKTTAYTTLA